MRHVVSLAMCGLGLACTTNPPVQTDTGPQPGTQVDEGLYTLTVLAPHHAAACDAHAEQPSQFTDATSDWGLGGLAMGAFYAADLDHDGYPDLIVLSGNQDERETIPRGANWDVGVLMNRTNPQGGRMFVDATAESGLFQIRGGSTTEYRMTQIVAVADVNNDGNPDVFAGVAVDGNSTNTTGDFNQDKSEILLNDGHGHFTLAPQSDPSKKMEPENYQAVMTDVDNDGIVDLYLTYWYSKPGYTEFGSQAQLFHGNGDGTFTSVTNAAGLTTIDNGSTSSLLAGTNARPSFGATACDLNGDGYPELMLSSYGGQSNMLYVNDGTGAFQRAVQPGGFDGDDIVDYHDNQYFLCYCSVHASDAYCAGAAKPGVQCPSPADSYWTPTVDGSTAMANGNNFSAACRDIDGDGKPDLFQGTIRHWWAGNATDPSQILLNATGADGNIVMNRVASTTSGVTYPHLDPLGWNEGIQQTTLVDMDNDGRVDILNGGSDYAYQYGHLFVQQGDGTFQDVAQTWGMTMPCMDGLAVADFDRDGDLDVLTRGSLYRDCATGWKAISGKDPGFAGYKTNELHMFTNDAGSHSNWLELRFAADGTTTNATGIGASVKVTASGVTQVQQVLGAHGIGSESDDPGILFFGLGACDSVDKIEVTWPNQARTQDTWIDVPSNHMIELRQGDPTLYGVNLASAAHGS